LKNTKIALKVKGQGQMSRQLSITSSVHRGTYFYQATSISDRRQTDATKNDTCFLHSWRAGNHVFSGISRLKLSASNIDSYIQEDDVKVAELLMFSAHDIIKLS